jgi:hypothetical protein
MLSSFLGVLILINVVGKVGSGLTYVIRQPPSPVFQVVWSPWKAECSPWVSETRGCMDSGA